MNQPERRPSAPREDIPGSIPNTPTPAGGPAPLNWASVEAMRQLAGESSSAESGLPLDGMLSIIGRDHHLLVEVRDLRVVRFRRAGAVAWNEPRVKTELVAPPATVIGDRFVLRWTYRDLAEDGHEAIRQEFAFEGSFRDECHADGELSLRMIADFLKPCVVLANTCESATLEPIHCDEASIHAA